MPIAAVPEYLLKAGGERIFQDASPALRFGLLLPVWTKRQDQEEEVQQRAQAKSREGERIEALLKRKGMDETIGLLVREGDCLDCGTAMTLVPAQLGPKSLV
jgi:hypothetical protein